MITSGRNENTLINLGFVARHRSPVDRWTGEHAAIDVAPSPIRFQLANDLDRFVSASARACHSLHIVTETTPKEHASGLRDYKTDNGRTDKSGLIFRGWAAGCTRTANNTTTTPGQPPTPSHAQLLLHSPTRLAPSAETPNTRHASLARLHPPTPTAPRDSMAGKTGLANRPTLVA
ncbi:hypothetical protein FRC09_019742 [Ceratobasidium sp. 395]|nr:hypothetical protein FRC09_019742 [Ceratobasidium sp. 395]